MDYSLPHARVLLEAMTLTAERLKSGTKAAVPLPILRAILAAATSQMPFNKEFYLATYSDVAAACRAGQIRDPHAHFIESGYLEGRQGAKPEVDESYYRKTYPDVAAAIGKEEIKSAYEHYVKSGAAEGRYPNEAYMAHMKYWQEVFSRK